jgi:hypothetical protein
MVSHFDKGNVTISLLMRDVTHKLVGKWAVKRKVELGPCQRAKIASNSLFIEASEFNAK